jgi:hypothetical protein
MLISLQYQHTFNKLLSVSNLIYTKFTKVITQVVSRENCVCNYVIIWAEAGS